MSELEKAHIWAAKFSQGIDADSWFDEIYSEGEAPISRFAQSQEEWFYDHDFFYVEEVVESIENTVKQLDLPENNQKIIIDSWKIKVDASFDHIVVGDQNDFATPQSVKEDGVQIVYIGLFNHW